MRTVFALISAVLLCACHAVAQTRLAPDQVAPGVAFSVMPEQNARREYAFLFAGEHKDNNRCTLSFNRWDQNGAVEFYIEVTSIQPARPGLKALQVNVGGTQLRLLPDKPDNKYPLDTDYAVFHLPQQNMHQICSAGKIELVVQGSKTSYAVQMESTEALRNFASRCALRPLTARRSGRAK
jgi:hypothetical protein